MFAAIMCLGLFDMSKKWVKAIIHVKTILNHICNKKNCKKVTFLIDLPEQKESMNFYAHWMSLKLFEYYRWN